MINCFRNPIVLIIGLIGIILTAAWLVMIGVVSVEITALVIAWLVGILALLQEQIKNFFFPPVLKVKIKELVTTTNGGWEEKWYNIVIKNEGYGGARNIRVKIKDEEHKSWINLVRPFAIMREDKIFIHMLATGEDGEFNIGHSDSRNSAFTLATNLIPNNQKIVLQSGESHTYFVNIVSDSTEPIFTKIKIDNVDYSVMSASNISIIT